MAPRAVLLGLGANLGRPTMQLQEAVRRLASAGHVVRVSGIYRTAPLGPPQPDFVNAVAVLETDLPPLELLRSTQAIEHEMGRVRGVRNGPRLIDIDLLDYAGEVFSAPGLALPHPRLAERAFVLVPLAEVAPRWRHPVVGYTARELLEHGAALDGGVERIGDCVASSGDERLNAT